MKRILTVLLSLVLATSIFAGCSGTNEDQKGEGLGVARTITQIKDSGFIRIGVFRDNKPFGYIDENGEYQGYDVYFAKRLAKDLGVGVEFVSVETNNRVECLKDGKIDVLLANFTVTKDRSEQVDFALPYMKVDLDVISTEDNEGSNTVAPAVQKGNSEMKDWINEEIKKLDGEKFFNEDFEETVKPIYGDKVKSESVVIDVN